MTKRTVAALLGLALTLAGCTDIKEGAGPPSHADLAAADVAVAAQAMQQALETLPDGQSLAWRGAEGEASGSFKLSRTYVSASGYFCRQYVEKLRLGERAGSFQHEACRDEQGHWVWL
jgi:surface antigen